MQRLENLLFFIRYGARHIILDCAIFQYTGKQILFSGILCRRREFSRKAVQPISKQSLGLAIYLNVWYVNC